MRACLKGLQRVAKYGHCGEKVERLESFGKVNGKRAGSKRTVRADRRAK